MSWRSSRLALAAVSTVPDSVGCTKQVFRDAAAAWQYCRNDRHVSRGQLRPYTCRLCSGVHVTSMATGIVKRRRRGVAEWGQGSLTAARSELVRYAPRRT